MRRRPPERPTLTVIRSQPRPAWGAGVVLDPEEVDRRKPPTVTTDAGSWDEPESRDEPDPDLGRTAVEMWYTEQDRQDREGNDEYEQHRAFLEYAVAQAERRARDGRASSRTRAAALADAAFHREALEKHVADGPQPVRNAKMLAPTFDAEGDGPTGVWHGARYNQYGRCFWGAIAEHVGDHIAVPVLTLRAAAADPDLMADAIACLWWIERRHRARRAMLDRTLQRQHLTLC